jgi:hypothetical protein
MPARGEGAFFAYLPLSWQGDVIAVVERSPSTFMGISANFTREGVGTIAHAGYFSFVAVPSVVQGLPATDKCFEQGQ